MSHDRHLTRALLRAVYQGEGNPRTVMEFFASQLGELCPACREELRAFFDDEVERTRGWEPFLASGRQVVGARSRKGAEELLVALRPLPPAERLELLRRAPQRFVTERLAGRLLEEGLSCLPGDPEAAHAWAELAEALLDTLPGEEPTLRLRAASHRANARRAMGDLQEAKEGFGEVRRLQQELGVHEPAVLAEIASQEASLHITFRDFERAEGLLNEALVHFRDSGKKAEICRVLMKLSNLYRYAGDPEAALALSWQAANDMPLHEWRLSAYATLNVASNLADAGDPDRARSYLQEHESTLSLFLDPLSQLRRTWLEGRVEAEVGEPAVAEAALLAARQGFEDRGIGFDVASVSLDLALLYLKQKRYEDLERVTTEAVTLFQAHAVHRDALAALILLRDAVAVREAQAATIERVARYLQEAQLEPRARRPRPT